MMRKLRGITAIGSHQPDDTALVRLRKS